MRAGKYRCTALCGCQNCGNAEIELEDDVEEDEDSDSE